MVSVRRQILDALATRFSLPGWTVAVRSQIDPANPPAGATKIAYIIDTGESTIDTDDIVWTQVSLDIVVEVVALIGEATTHEGARVLLDASLVELQKALHVEPRTFNVPGLEFVRSEGMTFAAPDERNIAIAEWRLTAEYRHNHQDPEVWDPVYA